MATILSCSAAHAQSQPVPLCPFGQQECQNLQKSQGVIQMNMGSSVRSDGASARRMHDTTTVGLAAQSQQQKASPEVV